MENENSAAGRGDGGECSSENPESGAKGPDASQEAGSSESDCSCHNHCRYDEFEEEWAALLLERPELEGMEDEVREILEGLLERLEVVMILHNHGCDQLFKLSGMKFVHIDVGHLEAIVVHLAERIAEYNRECHIYPREMDTTKILTFAAPLLEEVVDEYSAVPLFYQYLRFLDDSYLGTGINLSDFGNPRFFAENLRTIMSAKKEWLGPFCFFRAIDLSFDRCALRRINELQERVEALDVEVFELKKRVRELGGSANC